MCWIPSTAASRCSSPDGAVVREWGEAGSEEGQFVEPVGLAIDAAGRVYVADTDNGRVQIFDANGQFLEAWAPIRRMRRDSRHRPANIEVDAAGIVSVTDWNTNQVVRLDADGTVLDTFGRRRRGAGDAGPWGMTSDGQGNLFVADHRGNRIQVFAPDGTLLGTIGGVGVQPGQFIIPEIRRAQS